MRKPSLAALEAAFPGKGRELRRALTDSTFCANHSAGFALIQQCFSRPTIRRLRLEVLNAILEGHGVDDVAEGGNRRSPAFDYIIMGDAYDTTILRLPSGYWISTFGDQVEKGNYE